MVPTADAIAQQLTPGSYIPYPTLTRDAIHRAAESARITGLNVDLLRD